jgi:membrane fusion protein (multidrug efflux system)
MVRKIIQAVVAILILFLGLTVMGFFEDSKQAQPKNTVKTAATVFTVTVVNQSIPVEIVETGILNAKNRIELFAEVQGVMLSSSPRFKAGQKFSQGQRLVSIESDVFRANLKSQKSQLLSLITSTLADLKLDYPASHPQWEAYVEDFDLNDGTPDLPEALDKKERLFLTGRNVYSTYYNLKNAEITLEKYNLYAPFNGMLTEGLVDPGTLIRPGQKLGSFVDPSVYEMETPVSAEMVKHLSVGQEATLSGVGQNPFLVTGKITRINSMVNSGTQTVNVYIEVKGDNLEEGMFMSANITASELENAFEIDRSVLFNGNQVFVAKDSTLIQKQVEPIHFDRQKVVVRGLTDGDQVLSKMAPGAHPGMLVSIYQEN